MTDIRGSRRRWLLSAFAGCTALLAGASFSWACTAEAGIQLFPKSGPAGTEVAVIGDAFAEGKKVEIRLDSPRGELLGTAYGPSFETMVVLPEMSPGEHTIIGMILQTGGDNPRDASAAFAPQQFLTTPGSAPSGNEGGQQGNNGGQQQGNGAQQQGNQGTNAGQPSSNGTGTDRGDVALSSGADQLDRTAVDTGRTVFAGSVAIGDPVQAAAGKAPVGPGASGQSLFGAPVADAPSLGLGAQASGDDPLRTPFAIGIALMAFGSLALVAGAFMFLLLGKREARAAEEPAEL